ncbi:LysR family transcriptional regulator [Photobacterium sp. GJ3]|uniref:LysR family transcriptional regulator n=1 Tax=Photobacterium sp. GJ3 TaxID=2829502 RepID=UPI001B8CE5CB|nr:LysR family transcriptional regulator [Photobacterium sp. GJ3]QUJ68875.1 LysR family transcriptional regulator [Photobacterium sp. GJ3]
MNGQSDIDLNLLRTLRVLCLKGSIKATAHQLKISESAVSKQISKLSSQLGQTLFERNHYGMQPTAYTQQIISRLEKNLDQIELLLTPENFDPDRYQGHISLALPAILIESHGFELYKIFHHLFPRSKLSLLTWNPKTVEQIERNEITLGVNVWHDSFSQKIYQTKICDFDVGLVSAKHFNIHGEKMLELPFIHMEIPGWNDNKRYVLDYLISSGIPIQIDYYLDNISLCWEISDKQPVTFIVPDCFVKPNFNFFCLKDMIEINLHIGVYLPLIQRSSPLHKLIVSELQRFFHSLYHQDEAIIAPSAKS